MKTTLDRAFVRRFRAGVFALGVALTSTAGLVAAGSRHGSPGTLPIEQTLAMMRAAELRCRQYGKQSLQDALSLGAELYASSTRLPSADAIQRASYGTATRGLTCSTGRAR